MFIPVESFTGRPENYWLASGILIVNFRRSTRLWIADPGLFNVLLRQAFGHAPLVYSEDLVMNKVGSIPTVTLVIGDHITVDARHIDAECCGTCALTSHPLICGNLTRNDPAYNR